MKYSCSFYLDKEKNGFCPINAVITFTGIRLRYYIGYRIHSDNFKLDSNEFGKRYRASLNSRGLEGKTPVKSGAINDRMDAIQVELSNLLRSAKEAPTKQFLIDKLNTVCNKVESEKPIIFVDTFWPTSERYLKETDVTPLSRKQLKSSLKHLKNFEDTLSEKFTFDNFTAETLTAFDKWLNDGTRGRNSISSTLKKIQRFFSWAIKEQKMKKDGIKINNPFTDFTVTPEIYGTPIILEKKERDLLYDFAFDNDRMKKVRDIFIFQCYCGARISDLMKLTTANLNNGILSYVPMKTSKETMKTVSIPLNKKALTVLKRYNNPEGYLLPRMSDVEINRTLKPLFKVAELNRTVEHLNPLTGQIDFVPLHEVASTHLARRVFIGLLYADGEKDAVIASMSGHSENSKAFSRYKKVDMKQKVKATKKQ